MDLRVEGGGGGVGWGVGGLVGGGAHTEVSKNKNSRVLFSV